MGSCPKARKIRMHCNVLVTAWNITQAIPHYFARDGQSSTYNLQPATRRLPRRAWNTVIDPVCYRPVHFIVFCRRVLQIKQVEFTMPGGNFSFHVMVQLESLSSIAISQLKYQQSRTSPPSPNPVPVISVIQFVKHFREYYCLHKYKNARIW